MTKKQQKINKNLKKVNDWIKKGFQVEKLDASDRVYARRILKYITKKDGKTFVEPVPVYGGNVLIGMKTK